MRLETACLIVATVLLLASADTDLELRKFNCLLIGAGTGCSGCNSGAFDCEWCTPAGNDGDINSQCLPRGYCDSIPGFVPDHRQCPDDPAKEPHYHGTFAENNIGAHFARDWSPSFDSEYCDFPEQPWVVDRTSVAGGWLNPAEGCRRVNNQLAVGQRGKIEECLFGTPPSYGGLGHKKLTVRQEECIRLYQSYLCTFSCPHYGDAWNKNFVCKDYCDRLNQVCGSELLSCLRHGQYIPMSCIEPTPTTPCSRPELVPASGKFEYDLCFYGDPRRCADKDCEVTAVTGVWPDTLVTFRNDYEPYEDFVPGSSGPSCCVDEDFDIDEGVVIATVYRVKSEPVGSGLDCETVIYNLESAKWTDQAVDLWTSCDEDLTGFYCASFTTVVAGDVSLPAGCNDVDQILNCPGVVDYFD